jgi:hippurate hydrolase
MMDRAVVTVGALQAGSSPNIIPDDALLRLNVRTFDEQVRESVLSAIKRIINGEATASRAPKPPTFNVVGEFPLTSNDEAATGKVTDALKDRFGSAVQQGNPATASEDFSVFARTWGAPLVFWFVGGTDPQKYAEAAKAGLLHELPSNHSPQFAPVLSPTLRVGIEAMLSAAGPWLTNPVTKH